MSGRRRRLWRWALAVWTGTAVVGGGLTLWLQDSGEPRGPYSWEQNEPGGTPSLPEGWQTMCPSPAAEDGPAQLLCFVRTR